MPTPYRFFLSYARVDSQGEQHVRRLFEDLCRELRRAIPLPAEEPDDAIGFFDATGIEPGDQWSDELINALQTSHAFICLYSRGYFNSAYCGREFFIFRQRIKGYARANGVADPPLIIPVLWDRRDRLPKTLPEEITRLQYTNAVLGELYSTEGLRYIAKRQGHRDEYEEFIDRFADTLAQRMSAPALAPLSPFPEIRNSPSAFDTPAPLPAGGGESPGASSPPFENVGPGVVHFVYVAGKPQEIQPLRQVVDAYHEQGGCFWRPYAPAVDKPVGLITQGIANDAGLLQRERALQNDIVAQLRRAEETNTIVVLVVDPWTLQIQSYAQYMQQFDAENFVNCGAVVVWNDADSELPQHQQTLDQLVNATFQRNVITGNPQLRRSVRSEQDLRKELVGAIDMARRRIIERAKLFITPRGSAPLPRVQGPA